MSDRYTIDQDGRFVVRDFNRAKPFSSFLPGIAGLWGVPTWAFYVNRGQAIACFGTRDKDHSFLEFESVKLHQHRTATEGFRTFLKVAQGDRACFYEPFRADPSPHETTNRIEVTPHGLELIEDNTTLNLRVHVQYTTLCDHPFAALIRRLSITNIGDEVTTCEVLDGLPRVLPYGQSHDQTKMLPFVNEGYLEVRGDLQRMPFIKLRAQSTDSWEVHLVQGGHFFCGRAHAGKPGLLPTIVDPELVFGDYADLVQPYAFLEADPFDPRSPQGRSCQTCCGFLHRRFAIDPGEDDGVDSLWGMGEREERLAEVARAMRKPELFDDAWAASERTIAAIADRFFLHTADERLNAYLPQTYLDNVLRGGLPISLSTDHQTTVFHAFSRKHGDLERDYNFFSLSDTRFSQGNGNFRDVNQNRRHDVWFNPDVGMTNVHWFFNLIQLDGFNPLLIRGTQFQLADEDAATEVLRRAPVAGVQIAAALDHLRRPFTPGSLLACLEEQGITFAEPRQALAELLACSEKLEDAEFAQGYWVDHWSYNLDHIESFLAIFPERLRELLIERDDFTYYDPPVRVLDRDEKYVLCQDGQVRQLDCVAEAPEKLALLNQRADKPHKVRTDHGRGAIYTTNLLQKLICILVNKVSSLAPSGLGIDMEAGHPGWLDSINGLPGAFGSSTSELYQLLRTIGFVRDSLNELGIDDAHSQPVPEELASFFEAVIASLESFELGEDFNYWDRCSTAREQYRARTRLGLGGEEVDLSVERLRRFLDLAESHLRVSLERTIDPGTGLPATYYRHNATDWQPLGDSPGGMGKAVRVTAFDAHQLPLFLEAPMHAMRTVARGRTAEHLHQAVRQSPLYDRPLGMYLTGDSVRDEGPELGRLWSWSPGWFENENIFLHAEHKYLLACLRAGLHESFFEDMSNCFLPFQDPQRYGRNPLENASFIMSSRQPKPGYQGRGYQPRTSGMTAEVIEAMLFCLFGPRPFAVADGELTFTVRPTLPGWLFSESPTRRRMRQPDGSATEISLPAGCVAAPLFSRTLIILENPERRPTYGEAPMRVGRYVLTDDHGERTEHEGPSLRGAPARALRGGAVAMVTAKLTRTS